MKNLNLLILLFAVAFLFSCAKKEGIKREIKLINNLGYIKIYLPKDYDTFSTWKKISCDGCGDEQYYRFQNSGFPIHLEKRFNPDTFYHFSIRHFIGKNCYEIGKEFIKPIDSLLLWQSNKHLQMYPGLKFQIKEIKEINGKEFAIFGYSHETEENKEYQYIIAWTYHKRGIIHFEFTSFKSINKNDNFIQKSYNALLSLEIKD